MSLKLRILTAAVAVALVAVLVGAASSQARGPIQALTMKIPDTGTSGPAYPFPSTHTVTGVQGVVTDVNVVIPKLFHAHPADIEMAIVGPQGQKVMLTSDACESPVAGVTWTFDDEATAVLDDFATRACATGSYRPSDLFDRDVLPGPAPAGPYGTSLSVFDGTDPNGEWKLYVADDAEGATGGMTEFWSAQVETRPKPAVSFAARSVEFAEGQPGGLTLRRPAATALGAGSVNVTSDAVTADAGTDFEPVPTTVEFAPGETEKTIPVRALADAVPEGAETFDVSISGATGDAVIGTPATASVMISAPAGTDGANDESGGGGAAPRCGGKPATIVGTARGDVLRGTKRSDVIVALGGNDVVVAASGNDIVCGGAGNDRLSGGSGRDRLFGDAGRDRLTGGAGRDRLVGGSGRDTCVIGKPRDRAGCELRR